MDAALITCLALAITWFMTPLPITLRGIFYTGLSVSRRFRALGFKVHRNLPRRCASGDLIIDEGFISLYRTPCCLDTFRHIEEVVNVGGSLCTRPIATYCDKCRVIQKNEVAGPVTSFASRFKPGKPLGEVIDEIAPEFARELNYGNICAEINRLEKTGNLNDRYYQLLGIKELQQHLD